MLVEVHPSSFWSSDKIMIMGLLNFEKALNCFFSKTINIMLKTFFHQKIKIYISSFIVIGWAYCFFINIENLKLM